VPPLLSAIVLNYRTPKEAVACTESLLAQTIADQLEVIVVDNHSRDDSVGVLRRRIRDPRVRIVEAPGNLGFGGGNNYGERYVLGEYVLIINPDTEPEPRALERLITVLKEDPGIGIVAPRLLFPDGTTRDSYRTFPTMFDIVIKRTVLKRFFPGRLTRYLQHDRDPLAVREVDWVVGAFLLMRRKVYEDLQGFDERFFLFFEDTDLCRRVWQSGKRVLYFPRVSARDSKHRLSGSGFLHLITKHTGRVHMVSALKYFWKWRMAGGNAA
jgi:hypothetical protein